MARVRVFSYSRTSCNGNEHFVDGYERSSGERPDILSSEQIILLSRVVQELRAREKYEEQEKLGEVWAAEIDAKRVV
jgi:hypothetical protein